MFRRCTRCGGTVDSACGRCGGRRFSWTYVVDVPRQNGRRTQRTKGGFATKAAAVHAMNAMQASVASGTWVVPSKLTLREYLEDLWLPGIRGEVRGGTWGAYELHVRRYIAPHLGDTALQAVTRSRIKALYAILDTQGGVRSGRGLSAKTVHNVHLTLRKALGDAVEDRLLTSNPAERAHRLSSDRRDMRTWSAEELAVFLEVVRGDRYFGLWRLAATSGMRRGELLGLRWSDVDIEGAVLRVQQQRVRGAEGVSFGAPKTATSRRSIPLDPATIAALRVHRRAQREERLAFGPGYQEHDLVFARPDGSPLDPDTVSQSFDRHQRRARLPRIRFHDLRHTHATLALAVGVHPKVVQERLGHSSITVTLDTYSHAVPAMQAEAASRIAALIDS